VDLDLSATDGFRAEVRSWLREHVPASPLPSLETSAGFDAHREWERELHGARLSVVSWPEEYGGRGCTPLEWLVFEEEYYAAGAPGRVSQNGINLLAPTLFLHGTGDQRSRFLPSMASGEVIWAQAWSEPGAGSDLASLRSSARRTDQGWLLNGQKTWSSRAAFADRGFGPFRTDPEAGRHKGLTYFTFPLDAPGITRRPIGRLDGKPAFAELFFDDVFVPATDVIGEPGDGWRVATDILPYERSTCFWHRSSFLFSRLDRLVGEAEEPDAGAIGSAYLSLYTARARCRETVRRFDAGGKLGPETSVDKILLQTAEQELFDSARDLIPGAVELDDESPWRQEYLYSRAATIYGGTAEIQRNIVARRLLDLGKEQ
jgi:alkylation response protein AidB-like acyl-CoA dehydrogenase